MKNIEKFIFEKKIPSSTLEWNNIIKEDSKNKAKRIYDKNIFKNSKIFKIKIDDEEKCGEEIEKKKKEEESKKEYEKTLKRIEKLESIIELDTNQIKADMELDMRKREEIKKKLEEERLKKKREAKEKEEEERLKKEKEKKEREEKERKEREAKLKREIKRNMEINNQSGTIKEKLIKAGNNFVNIKKEIKKINENKALKKKSNEIFKDVMEIISNITTLDDVDKNSKKINEMFKEFKEKNHKDFYLYICFYILVKINDILTSTELNYYDCYIKVQLIHSLNNKTLTYLFFQNICYDCPFIIPVKNYENIFKDQNIQKKKNNLNRNRKESSKRFTILEYIYFIFLRLDINKNINILEDYLNNMEIFQPNEINHLIANSFSCFINVFGNYIRNNKINWMNKIEKIIKNIKIGLEKERNTKYSDIKNIIDKINYDLEDNYKSICENKDTKFLKKLNNK